MFYNIVAVSCGEPAIVTDTCMVTSSANSSTVELSLLQDTRLLVLHYLSSDQTDSSTTTASDSNHYHGRIVYPTNTS